ncbi:gamma-aminobutyric acid receptor subunit beta-like [Ruditapes philippinarum]|uniref:gamma-aminobutyric acid receptor subunit beta-like n=1 Tax=Ruditapes philippinarum TaxID=129788 RepID=UPI00295AF3DF|nr:gamma-aminobutyric acid receptor subunit beta-like [Ruditapes philippinarum]
MIVNLMLFSQCILIITVTGAFCADIEPTRNDLMRYLLEEAEYDHNFPPSTENVTDVSVQLYITDFNSESDKDREIEFTLYLRINWTDPRLDFTRNKTTYDVINFGDDMVKNLWIPDLYFLNERQSRLHGLFERNQLAYIYKNGSVFYSGRFNIKLHCVMTFEKYPFDTQKCPIEIQSYAYSTDYVLLHWNGDHAVQIDPSADPFQPKIPLQDQSVETRYTYPITGEFSTLRTEIQIPRPKGSYIMMIIIPSIILVVTALTSFLLRNNITSRIGVPTGTLISMFVQWSGTYGRLSLDSTSMFLDILMVGNLSFLGSILIINAWICHYRYNESSSINGNQKEETTINGNQKEETTINGNQKEETTINGNQKEETTINGNQTEETYPLLHTNDKSTGDADMNQKKDSSITSQDKKHQQNKCSDCCLFKCVNDKLERLAKWEWINIASFLIIFVFYGISLAILIPLWLLI